MRWDDRTASPPRSRCRYPRRRARGGLRRGASLRSRRMDALALPFDDEPTLTVGQLGSLVGEAIQVTIPGSVWVRGEVSQLRASSNGHAYFQLVEKDARRDAVKAVVSVALFRNDRAVVNRALKDAGVRLADGVEVRIRGRVEFYPPQ